MAGQVGAQNVTAPGLKGNPACAGGYLMQKNLAALDSTNNADAVTNTSLPFKLSTLINWTNLRGLLGIADNPVSSITVYGKVKNTRTNTDVRTIDLGAVTSGQNPSYATTNVTLTAKTPYVIILYTDYSGLREENPFAVQCFMTGGTYNVTDTFVGGRSGCLQLNDSFDIRNCLCGRSNLAQTLPNQPQHTHDKAWDRLGCK